MTAAALIKLQKIYDHYRLRFQRAEMPYLMSKKKIGQKEYDDALADKEEARIALNEGIRAYEGTE